MASRPVSREKLEEQAYARSLVTEMRGEFVKDGDGLRPLAQRLGVSHVYVRDFLKGDVGGAKIIDWFIAHRFKKSVDAFRVAAHAFAEQHPEVMAATEGLDDPLPNRRALRALPQFSELPDDVREEIVRDQREGDLPFWWWCAEVKRLLDMRDIREGYQGSEWRQRKPKKRSRKGA